MTEKKKRGRPVKRTFERIPDTFENVIKALVKPVAGKKEPAKSDQS